MSLGWMGHNSKYMKTSGNENKEKHARPVLRHADTIGHSTHSGTAFPIGDSLDDEKGGGKEEDDE